MSHKPETLRMSYLTCMITLGIRGAMAKRWYKTIANLISGHMVYEDIRGQLKAVRK